MADPSRRPNPMADHGLNLPVSDPDSWENFDAWEAERLAGLRASTPAPGQVENGRATPGAAMPKPAGTSTPGRYTGRRVDVAALLAEPDIPIPWRCDQFVADGYLTTIASEGGEGKSWLSLTLALGVSTGTPRAGIGCQKGRAIIFDAENGRDLLRRRLRAAGVTHGISIVLVDGLDVVKDREWFASIIREEKANLAVFDSLRILTSGRDEDKSGDMEAPMSTLRRIARDTGAGVLLVHHRGKGPSETRGSSVIKDQTDMLFTLARDTQDPERRTRRKLETRKCRIDEEPAPRWVSIDADRSRGLVTVNEAEPFEGETTRPRDALRDDVLSALTEQPQRRADIARRVGREPQDGTVGRVLGDLVGDGLAVRSGTDTRPTWNVPRATPLGDGTWHIDADAELQGLQ